MKTSGIDFDKFEREGIDVQYFGELLTMSGLVLNDKVKWLSFHSSYDFGYLLKVLTCTELPSDEQSFLDLLHIYFPGIYDIKVRSNNSFILYMNININIILYFLYNIIVYDDGSGGSLRWFECSGGYITG